MSDTKQAFFSMKLSEPRKVSSLSNNLQRASRRWIGFHAAFFLTAVIFMLVLPVAHAQSNEWTWMAGSNTVPSNGGTLGEYGTEGAPSTTNLPGSRVDAVTWTDSSGNSWLFGGYGYDSQSGLMYLNDLWRFDSSNQTWTWVSGSNTLTTFPANASVYGTLGQPATGNVPGGRSGAVGWSDSKGNLWLFGGSGCNTNIETPCFWNDLWKFDPSSDQWAWMGGNDTDNQSGVYGVRGVPAAGNIPGARNGAVSWTDASGNFWLFGGYGYDANGTVCYLNDMWKYSPSTGEWTWVTGSDAVTYQSGQSGTCKTGGEPGEYGTEGTAASANTPGGRYDAMAWTDSKGDLWLFGGYGADEYGDSGYLNDLWMFNPQTDQWTWMGGANALNGTSGQPGDYQTWMTPSVSNFPGSRISATAWTDKSGNLWLFGGYGYDSQGDFGYLNDLWEFSTSTREWSWMGGSNTVPIFLAQPGVYGTKGTASFTNTPGGRDAAAGWVDSSGDLWLFGGYATDYDIGPGLGIALGYFNDLWKYQPNDAGLPQTATPDLSLSSGTYPAGQLLTISDATTGASIYYFTSGSSEATPYTQPVAINASETVEAVAVAPGYSHSPVASANFSVPVTAAPTFSVAPGTYSTTQSVSIATATPNATIYYAINGQPTTSSTVYNGPITVPSSETIEAIAVSGGYAISATATATYTIWPASAVNQWAWMGGENANLVLAGVYGTRGVPSISNFPGARQYSATWVGKNGNLWLFGGLGSDAKGNSTSYMNDLWEFNPSTREWTWIGGSSTVGSIAACPNGGCGQSGVYGTLGVASASNIPGGREGAATWTDANGNFWLFGGYGYDASGTLAYLNDLWKYDPVTNEWTWMGGSSTVTDTCFGGDSESPGMPDFCGGPQGVYGALGTPASTSVPGGREYAMTWTDSQGNLWLFGGYAINSSLQAHQLFNDLWKYNPSTNQWTWMSGSDSLNGGYCVSLGNEWLPFCGFAGNYGTLGKPAVTNIPGSRFSSAVWMDKNGDLWLLGGTAFDASAKFNPMNDVWEFTPSNSEWTWIGGSSTSPDCSADINDSCGITTQNSVYGATGKLGIPNAGTFPWMTSAPAFWTDGAGNAWIFAGSSDRWGPNTGLNDLFEYTPSANEWAWMSGSPTGLFGVEGTYGTLGIPAAANTPGTRYGAASWTDANGNFWLFGGYGFPDGNVHLPLNDLWKYKPSAPAPVPSFAVNAVPNTGSQQASVTVDAGSSVQQTIAVTIAGGFSSSVSLSASNLPSGVTTNFSPSSVTGFGTSQMTISADAATAPGNYTLTVTGTSGNTTETTTVLVTVDPAPAIPPNFTLSASSTSLTVNSGGSGTATLTVTPQNGFAYAVNFSCSGLPAGASCSFSPATVTPSGSAVTTQLTISDSTQAALLKPDFQPIFSVMGLAGLICLFTFRKKWRMQLVLLLVIACGGFFVIGCGGAGTAGGSSSGAGGGGGTGSVPQTSTVTVSATSGNLQQNVQLSLTVK